MREIGASNSTPATHAVPAFAVVIPTRNAGDFTVAMIAALRAQRAQPVEVLIIDSGSEDGTPERFRAAGCRVHSIAPRSFDHGGTRNLGIAMADRQAEVIVFLTQDAVPASPESLGGLVRRFTDPTAALCYGRQVPRPQAGAIERHARLFNYRTESAVRRLPEARALGIKAVFASNSFAAYRRRVLHLLGGFPAPVIMGEDQVFAARALLAGWSVVYAADAEVVHSHGYTPLEEFRRYFDTGAYHAAFPLIGAQFGSVRGEGLAFIKSELRYLGRAAPHLLVVAPFYWAAKYTGYRAGRLAARLPRGLCRALAMHKQHFRRPQVASVADASREAAD